MSYFLVEVRMSDAGQLDMERAARTLDAAQTRLLRTATPTRTIVAGFTQDDGRLVCLIEATSPEAVRRLLTMALLPAGRIREITRLTLANPLAGSQLARRSREATTPWPPPRRQSEPWS
jgi:hypothetical protein